MSADRQLYDDIGVDYTHGRRTDPRWAEAIDAALGQAGTVIPRVDWTSNCGNLSAGAALYAVHKGYVACDGDAAAIAIHQVNTGRRLRATVPLQDGRPALKGDFAIGGVPFGSAVAVNAAGVATKLVGSTGLLKGSYSVTAVYSGNTVLLGSTSDPYIQTITQSPSVTSLTSSAG